MARVWLPAGSSTPTGTTCVCNTITMGKAKEGGQTKAETTRTMSGTICSCDTICTCNTIATGGSSGGGTTYSGYHYWRPN